MSNGIDFKATGNLVADIDLRFSAQGNAWALSRAAFNKRVSDGQGGFKDATTFLDIKLFGKMAENAAESFSKGARVMIEGTLEQREWQSDSGEKRVAYQVVVDEIGASVRWATLAIERQSAAAGGGGGGQRQPARTAPEPEENPFLDDQPGDEAPF